MTGLCTFRRYKDTGYDGDDVRGTVFHTIMPPLALFNPLNEQLLLCVQTGKPLTGEE